MNMDESFSDFFHAMSGVTSQADKSQNSKNQMENMLHSSMPLGQQQFYPTPNSANMHTIQSEKQFMSPFPAVQQSYNNMSSDGTFAELDELLFTPMLSPAMTPAQQYQRPDLDWEHFDQNLFSLTSPAIEDNHAAKLVAEHIAKKQRVATSSKLSRQTSPATAPKERQRMRRDVPVHKEHTPDSNEGVSPVDLNNFSSQQAANGLGLDITTNTQPITPSMLMSLQARPNDDIQGQNDFTHSLDFATLPSFPLSIDTQMQTSPVPMAPPSRTPKTPGTPILNGSSKDTRPRSIASAHGRSKSVASSPAIGPLNPKAKTSPDLRPILPGGMSPQVGAMLASKSNYQHIVDGTYDQLNISYPEGMAQGLEVRRTSHKAAEQKRRDHLKECFEMLRTILPERPDAGASKVVVLKKGYDHIVHLHEVLKQKDEEIAKLKASTNGK